MQEGERIKHPAGKFRSGFDSGLSRTLRERPSREPNDSIRAGVGTHMVPEEKAFGGLLDEHSAAVRGARAE